MDISMIREIGQPFHSRKNNIVLPSVQKYLRPQFTDPHFTKQKSQLVFNDIKSKVM